MLGNETKKKRERENPQEKGNEKTRERREKEGNENGEHILGVQGYGYTPP